MVHPLLSTTATATNARGPQLPKRPLDVAERERKQVNQDDCRRYYQGPSKSVKSDVAVKLFSEAIKDGISYPSYVGDDTTEHAEIRLKTPVYYEIEKFIYINHPTPN